MSDTTRHGENIASQIQTEDAYGCGPGKMTLADVWLIIDNLHTHFMDTGRDTTLFEKWMDELEAIDNAEKRFETVIGRINEDFDAAIVPTGKYKKGDIVEEADK